MPPGRCTGREHVGRLYATYLSCDSCGPKPPELSSSTDSVRSQLFGTYSAGRYGDSRAIALPMDSAVRPYLYRPVAYETVRTSRLRSAAEYGGPRMSRTIVVRYATRADAAGPVGTTAAASTTITEAAEASPRTHFLSM